VHHLEAKLDKQQKKAILKVTRLLRRRVEHVERSNQRLQEGDDGDVQSSPAVR